MGIETLTRGPVPAVMTVAEAGAKLGICRNAAYTAVARGEIPTVRIGRLLKIPIAAFDRMLAEAGRGAA